VVTGEKSGTRIMEVVDSICDDYEIKDKLIKIVSDNGRNMLKAIRLIESEMEVPNNEESTSNAATEGEENDDENQEGEEENEDVTAKSTQTATQDAAGNEEDEEDEIDFEETSRLGHLLGEELEKRNKQILVRCFAHTLQLTIRDSLQSLTGLYSIMQKAFDISTKSRTKACFVEFLETKS
jgi:cobalamin biosynthesis protein CobT